MSKVGDFHTDTVREYYHPRERWVYHDQSECGYGQRVKRDGNAIPGRGTDPQGYPRALCDRCSNLA
jgi:hypothetical protein